MQHQRLNTYSVTPPHVYKHFSPFFQVRKLDEKISCFCICVTYLHTKQAPEVQTAQTQVSSMRPWRSLSICQFKVFVLFFSPGSSSVAWSDEVAELTPPASELRFWLCAHQSIIKPSTPTVDLLILCRVQLFPLSGHLFLNRLTQL